MFKKVKEYAELQSHKVKNNLTSSVLNVMMGITNNSNLKAISSVYDEQNQTIKSPGSITISSSMYSLQVSSPQNSNSMPVLQPMSPVSVVQSSVDSTSFATSPSVTTYSMPCNTSLLMKYTNTQPVCTVVSLSEAMTTTSSRHGNITSPCLSTSSFTGSSESNLISPIPQLIDDTPIASNGSSAKTSGSSTSCSDRSNSSLSCSPRPLNINDCGTVDPRLFCIFCNNQNHGSHACQKYNVSDKFWSHVFKDRLCKNCLRPYHRAEACYNRNFCQVPNCSRVDKHSPVLCRKRYSSSRLNYNPKSEFQSQFQCSQRLPQAQSPRSMLSSHSSERSLNTSSNSPWHHFSHKYATQSPSFNNSTKFRFSQNHSSSDRPQRSAKVDWFSQGTQTVETYVSDSPQKSAKVDLV